MKSEREVEKWISVFYQDLFLQVKNESEVEQWISVYDRDMHEKASEMEKESTIYDAERKEMERLEEYFNKVLAFGFVLVAAPSKRSWRALRALCSLVLL